MDFLFDSLAEVAVFLDRRFPTATERAALARLAGLTSTHPTWEALLEEADQGGRLAALLRSAADLRPEDQNLQAMATLCEQQHRDARMARVRTWTPRVLATGALAAAVLFVPWRAPVSPDDAVVAEPTDPPVEAVASVAVKPPAGTPEEPTRASIDAPVPAPAAQAPAAVAAETQDATPAPVDPNRPKGRCRSADRIVGYWYAGRSTPGAQGDVLTMDYAVRVRVDYPDVHNQFNARAPVTCHLVPGDRVRLTDAPIHVPGDAYWVPLVDGDLLPPGDPVAEGDTGSPE